MKRVRVSDLNDLLDGSFWKDIGESLEIEGRVHVGIKVGNVGSILYEARGKFKIEPSSPSYGLGERAYRLDNNGSFFYFKLNGSGRHRKDRGVETINFDLEVPPKGHLTIWPEKIFY